MNPIPFPFSRLWIFAIALLMLGGTGVSRVQARGRGFKLITYGETVTELGPVSREHLPPGFPPGTLKVGFRYDYFGFFWLDLWNWDGEYVVYNPADKTGGVVSKADAGALMGVDEGAVGKPLNYRMPYLLTFLLGLVALKVGVRSVQKRRAAAEAAKFNTAEPWNPPVNPLAPAGPADVPGSGPPPLPFPLTDGVPAPQEETRSATPPPLPPPLPPEQPSRSGGKGD